MGRRDNKFKCFRGFPLKIWHCIPPYQIILEILAKNKSLPEEELFQKLKNDCESLGYADFLKALMCLELQGKIVVTRFKRDKKLVSLKT